ncbi:hypothetical protein [Nocardioides fonticola]|uniref:hypothetical protein n=1 Tax=Nocardioides fonticola TaxID=450363 RepID=UPI0031D24820
MPARPEVVCICGSMRFRAEMRAAISGLTMAGAIVLAPTELDSAPSEEEKAVLDALHLRRIDLADRVVVVAPDGYIGESTRREIAYARRHGKPVDAIDR